MTHPDLAAALAALDAGEPSAIRAILRLSVRAMKAAGEGRYCECDEPELAGADLVCGACLLQNQDQERRAVDRLVTAHAFEPGKLGGRMCAVCTMPERDPRHHGESTVGRCSWGERRLDGRVIR